MADSYEEYEEQRQEELRMQAEYGRRCKAASEILQEFLSSQREGVLNQLETEAFTSHERVIDLVIYLRILKTFEQTMSHYIEAGDLAEKEMMKDGE